jgi:hypothetical protein
MKVGDLVRVSGDAHPSWGWQNKVGVVVYVSEYMPAADVLFTLGEQMHFTMDTLEVIS